MPVSGAVVAGLPGPSAVRDLCRDVSVLSGFPYADCGENPPAWAPAAAAPSTPTTPDDGLREGSLRELSASDAAQDSPIAEAAPNAAKGTGDADGVTPPFTLHLPFAVLREYAQKEDQAEKQTRRRKTRRRKKTCDKPEYWLQAPSADECCIIPIDERRPHPPSAAKKGGAKGRQATEGTAPAAHSPPEDEEDDGDETPVTPDQADSLEPAADTQASSEPDLFSPVAADYNDYTDTYDLRNDDDDELPYALLASM